ncbi:hypothetical protein WN55_09811 [Dufourea novaeangliae]|uniref:Ubiquitin-like domain-containing protein n=1 Tax=Dufourea novaeangliae TaxID=178035 RepID=A0A154P769_DUFNO|nr:hypothetical protein WN55_09811 [Dufourea novaeangliae]
MGISPEDIKMIFKGKELHNSTIIEECDLGQQSILHAIRTPPQRLNRSKDTSTIEESSELSVLSDSGGKPINETLTDLPLDESDLQENSSMEARRKNFHKNRLTFEDDVKELLVDNDHSDEEN